MIVLDARFLTKKPILNAIECQDFSQFSAFSETIEDFFDIMTSTLVFRWTLFFAAIFFLAGIGCASTPPALLPMSSQVQGLAVIPKTESGEKALGQKQPRIIQNEKQQAELFNAIEINKADASTTSLADLATHDFVVKWKLRDDNDLDRSRLYLRLNSPRTFIYESDLGSSVKKYVIKMDARDAKKVWDAIGVSPSGL